MNITKFTNIISTAPSDDRLLTFLRNTPLNPKLLNSYDNKNSAPIHYAMSKNFSKSSRFLLENGTDINIRNLAANYGRDGWTPFAFSVSMNNLEMTEYLLERGA